MRTSVAGLAVLGGALLVNALAVKRASSAQQVVYWGQNDSERSMGDYCQSTEGVNVIVLAFLSQYGNGQTPNGSFGDSCSVDSSGNGSGCDSLASDITTCQAAGIKVFLSIGGGGASGTVTSASDAEGVAYTLWNSYANPAVVASGSPRPFGNAFVNGWDFDIESNPNGNNQYYSDLINKLRGYFATDTSQTYYISGAPQCPLPEENMGDAINNSKFDYLFVQFYNNPYCSAYQYVRPDGKSGDGFNFDAWQSYVSGTASSGASLFIGLPASPLASTDDESGAYFYLSPTELATVVNAYSSHPGFGGVMLWDAGNADTVNDNGCNYDQEVSSVLRTGTACGGSSGTRPSPSPSPASNSRSLKHRLLKH